MTCPMVETNTVRPRPRLLILGTSLSLLALAACGDKKPEGQVVAVVDGDEITSQEVNGELGAAANGEGTDQQLRNGALEQVIRRRLLAQVASEEGIENSPEYILRKRKLEENLLIQMLGEKYVRDVKQPSAQDVQTMMQENPQAFANRTVFAVDQIVFQKPERDEVVAALAPTKSMDEVVSVLNRFGVKFQRGSNTLDSANLPPAAFEQFKRVGTSEPMIIPSGATIGVVQIVNSKEVAPADDVARNVASNAFIKRQVEEKMKERLDALRKSAKVEYQSGFKAPEDPATGLPAAASSGAPLPRGTPAATGVPDSGQ